MKARISKSLIRPLLIGMVSAWVVMGAVASVLILSIGEDDKWSVVLGVQGVLLLALFPALRRGAWVYSNAQKYHSAEYLYDLGNGAEAEKAVKHFEKKVQKAMLAWMKRHFLKSQFGVFPVLFFSLLVLNYSVVAALFCVLLLALIIFVSVYVGMHVMLYSARCLCYNKFGTVKE